MTSEPTSRREQILATAAELFAARGFHGVSVADLGAACGVSGPAIYKHFVSKDAVLAEMLVSISLELLAVGRARVAAAPDPAAALASLVDWHADFALRHRPLIVVQDRDWQSLPSEARERVRALQREYVDLWAGQLRLVHTDLGLDRARAMAHAAFGLINSTPHSGLLPDRPHARPALHDGARRSRAERPDPRTGPRYPAVMHAGGRRVLVLLVVAVLGIVGGVATALFTATDLAPRSGSPELGPDLRPGLWNRPAHPQGSDPLNLDVPRVNLRCTGDEHPGRRPRRPPLGAGRGRGRPPRGGTCATCASPTPVRRSTPASSRRSRSPSTPPTRSLRLARARPAGPDDLSHKGDNVTRLRGGQRASS